MLHAESEKRLKFVKAESKLKGYINSKLTYEESLRRNQSHAGTLQPINYEQKSQISGIQ